MRTKFPFFGPGVATSEVLFADGFGAGASGEIAMNFKVGMRVGLIVAASLWVGAAGVRAAEGDAAPDTATNVGSATDTSTEAPAVKRHKRYAAKKPAPKIHKAAKTKSKSDGETDEASDAKPAGKNAAISPGVANANAQWPDQSTPATTSNMAAQADGVLQQVAPQPEQPASAAPADSQPAAQVSASDQLNDLDRAATNQAASAAAPLTLANATFDPAAAAQEYASQEGVAQDHSTWDRTSMIGKVFIALGGMLTMASAVRMFMA
jgi:hypothetical protein